MPIDSNYLQQRIDKLKQRIEALEDAYFQIASGAILSYTLDKGQSRQVVTKASLSEMQRVIDGMMNQLAVMCARLDGSGVQIVRPQF